MNISIIDKQKLAEWANIKLEYIPENDFGGSLLTGDRKIHVIVGTLEEWCPEKNSNQLDILEDRLDYKVINIVKSEFKFDCYYLLDDEDNWISGAGKTKNEARLTVILNFIKK